ncbi:hypothetical protein N7535_009353 [Penicillium sp. DV-2018c]|nr:hypothetical protein N7461_002740 [Penicillium sp. DV-2018c]KAJ5561156.1 hypothetical protein N7535_009353 [Penicillium sp. DV-2018c]
MTSKPLPPDAEALRGQIKSMIPEARESEEAPLQTATVLSEDSEGNKEYVGETLGQKVSALVKQLPIGPIGLGLDFGLLYKASRDKE